MSHHHTHLFGSDFFDSNSSNSTLKFDECEALTENTSLNALHFGDNSNATSSSSNPGMMDSLKDNPILTTASMPIPSRSSNGNATRQTNQDLSDFGFEFEVAQDIKMPLNDMFGSNRLNDNYHHNSPTLFALNSNGYPNSANSSMGNNHSHNTNALLMSAGFGGNENTNQINSHLQMWNDMGEVGVVTKIEPHGIEEDAIFQVDKADLIQGATMTLNEEDPLLDLVIDDFLLPQDNMCFLEEGQSLHSLQNVVISPLNSCTISPNNYSNSDNIQNSYMLGDPATMPMHSSNSMQHYNNQDNLSQLQSPSSAGAGPEISLYENSHHHHHSIPIKYTTSSSNSNPIVSPQTPSGSLTNHFQSLNATMSPRSSTASQALINRKYKSPVSIASNVSSNTASHTKRSALHDLLRKENSQSRSPDPNMLGQSVPGSSILSSGNISNFRSRVSPFGNAPMNNMSRLSSSAPTHLGMEQIWQRREPRPHLLSTSSMAEAAGSTSSLSTGGVLSPEAQDFSQDEDSDDDSDDHYEDLSSDDSDDDGKPKKMGSKKERYFWQYNVQAKGPKGQRLVIKTEVEDPHVLNEVTDPVFSPNCSVRGIKHSGKARKGDGNDLTPNPRKLNTIGKELDKLCRVINDMTPVSELPFNARPKTRKEKNKLASRACRLKKKAQHEANKIKLYGLEHEHRRLISGINQLKMLISAHCVPHNPDAQEEIHKQVEKITKSATKVKIAGESTEFVNQILEKVKAGDPRGGLGSI